MVSAASVGGGASRDGILWEWGYWWGSGVDILQVLFLIVVLVPHMCLRCLVWLLNSVCMAFLISCVGVWCIGSQGDFIPSYQSVPHVHYIWPWCDVVSHFCCCFPLFWSKLRFNSYMVTRFEGRQLFGTAAVIVELLFLLALFHSSLYLASVVCFRLQ